jgi:SAM-dependent methyltransferase
MTRPGGRDFGGRHNRAMCVDAPGGHGIVEPVVESRQRWLLGLLAAEPGSRVLDLGCGSGASLRFVAPVLRGGVAVGVDLAAALLSDAAAALGRAGRVALVRADLKQPLPFVDESFDRLLCHNVLESLPDPQALLGEAYRVLRPGGRFVLSHPDYDTLVFASEDTALTRRLVQAYSDTQQDWMDAVDGTMGRRLPEVVGRSRFRVLEVQAAVVLGRRFQPGELGYGYADNLVEALRGSPATTGAELERWLAGLRRLDERGAFLFSLNDYAVVCTR